MPDRAGALGTVLILGCGYTGRRVARRALGRGSDVLATTRDPARLAELARHGAAVLRLEVLEPDTLAALADLPEGKLAVLHSIPVVRSGHGWVERTGALLQALGNRPARVVYLSTSGVYGDVREVDETTPAAPRTHRGQLRLAAEREIASGPWSWMVLRPAAIYGPGRGVHESIRAGRHRLPGDGSNYVSRIHVDDLAALAEAALWSELSGAWPVADDEPCTAREMAAFCAGLLGLPAPPAGGRPGPEETRGANRRVDGRAVRRALGVELAYPSYRVGVPTAMAGGDAASTVSLRW